MLKKIPAWAIDLAERTVATFAEAFLAVETLNQTNLTQVSSLETAALAGGYAAGKFLLVKANAYLSSTNTPPAATK